MFTTSSRQKIYGVSSSGCRNRRRRNPPARRRLTLESLEARCLLSFGFDDDAASSLEFAAQAPATGLREPTAEELAWANRTATVVPQTLPNWLALDRIKGNGPETNAAVFVSPLTPALSPEYRGEGVVFTQAQADELPLSAIGVEAVAEAASGASLAATADELLLGAGDPPLPAAIDNSKLPYFPPIRSQGALGSCASFATTYYTMTYMTAMARGWDVRDSGDANKFSPKWSYNLLNGGADQGSSIVANYRVLLDHGSATWREFSYDADYRKWLYALQVVQRFVRHIGVGHLPHDRLGFRLEHGVIGRGFYQPPPRCQSTATWSLVQSTLEIH